MKTETEKQAILDHLRQLPILEIALKKTAVGRSTFYRWRKDDPEFAKAVDEAMTQGESMITDMSESQLVSLIRDKNFPSIQLWLKSHHPKYSNKLALLNSLDSNREPLTEEQKFMVEEGIKMAGALMKQKLQEYEQQQ